MTPESETQREVHFCYQCGRRIDPKRPSCWYCGASSRRTIRPPKKCPFCGSMIPTDAIKCRHCGEFVDGRKPEPASPPQQIVYLVDHRLLQTTADRRLLPGQPVPRDIALRLSPPTLKAIEQNRPDLIDDPMVRALPAPQSSSAASGYAYGGPIVDIGSEVVRKPGEDLHVTSEPIRLRPPERDLVHADSSTAVPARAGAGSAAGANLPSRLGDTPQKAGATIAGMLWNALSAFGRFLLRTAPGGRRRPAKHDSGPVDVDAESRYRICGQCDTEMLSSDAFCYHCGLQHRKTQIDLKKDAIQYKGADNSGIYVLAAILCAGLYWTGTHRSPMPDWGRPAMAGVAILLAASGFFRRRTSGSQFISIAIVAAAVGLWLALK